MEYTRNSDLSYYENWPLSTNCGSYALRLNEWYDLDDPFEDIVGSYIDDWIVEKYEEGYSNFDISCLYGEILIDCILNEFGEELEICDGRPPSTSDVELIAFCTFCYCDEGEHTDYDYHFKVFRNGKWKEKCGGQKVKECSIDEWGDYIGDVFYLYHKIKQD